MLGAEEGQGSSSLRVHGPWPSSAPSMSVTVRWAVSGELIGTHCVPLDWTVSILQCVAAAKISAAGHGCIPPDLQIMCGDQILPIDTLIQDVGFGPHPEVTVVRVKHVTETGY